MLFISIFSVIILRASILGDSEVKLLNNIICILKVFVFLIYTIFVSASAYPTINVGFLYWIFITEKVEKSKNFSLLITLLALWFL